MVFIISNNGDYSTYRVLKWLNEFEVDWIRVNEDSLTDFNEITINNSGKHGLILRVDKEVVNFENVSAYWYRRGDIRFDLSIEFEHCQDSDLRKQLKKHSHSELNYLRNGIHALLAEKPTINDRRISDLNKFDLLIQAQKCGLTIPDTIVTNVKDVYLNFKAKHSRIISKAIQNGMRMVFKDETGERVYQCFTERFDNPIEIPDQFFPTLFQAAIEKKYELRIFYLNAEFYPMVIFSQKDAQTATDFRKYNFKHPNRTMRYALPERIKEKLTDLMQQLRLNSGSIDLVYGKDGRYYFLEVNPVGQFGMVSAPCNYGLEKLIAKTLSAHE